MNGAAADNDFHLTDDAFLGGALQILQPQDGYRAAMDAVLLAASVDAKLGARILDVGAGVGVVSLCLAKRLTDTKVAGLEIQPELVRLAQENAARNDLANVKITEGDLLSPPSALPKNTFDVVVTNPPYYLEGEGRPAPNDSKRASHMRRADFSLGRWIDHAIKFVRPLGHYIMIAPADELQAILVTIEGQLGNARVFPLWPNESKPARRVIVAGQKGVSGPPILLPGLTLHAPPRRYSEEAEKVLRHGGGLDLGY